MRSHCLRDRGAKRSLTRIGSLPENVGRAWVSFPQMSMTNPRIRMLPPMVMMTIPSGVADLSGRIASRSKRAPTAVATRIAQKMAKGRGSLTVVRKKNDNIPPSITNSPWAKLMILVEL